MYFSENRTGDSPGLYLRPKVKSVDGDKKVNDEDGVQVQESKHGTSVSLTDKNRGTLTSRRTEEVYLLL